METTLKRLKDASEGLLYISESEHPFEVVSLQAVSQSIEDKLLELTGRTAGTPVKVVPVAHFFAPITKVHPGATPEQEQNAKHFQYLQQVLQEKLAEVAAYRVGTIQVDVFLLGKLKDGTYGGLRTQSIET